MLASESDNPVGIRSRLSRKNGPGKKVYHSFDFIVFMALLKKQPEQAANPV